MRDFLFNVTREMSLAGVRMVKITFDHGKIIITTKDGVVDDKKNLVPQLSLDEFSALCCTVRDKIKLMELSSDHKIGITAVGNDIILCRL